MSPQVLANDVDETVIAREDGTAIEMARKIFDKRVRRVVPPRRISREQPQCDHFEIAIDRRVDGSGPWRIGHRLLDDKFRNRSCTLERSATTKTLVEHHAERVEVAA